MDRLLPLRGLAMMMILVIGFVPPAQGQASSADDSAQDDRERKVMERFLGLLEKTPRRGTPLDKVYGYHVERGTLDAFLKTYQDRVAKDPKDGVGWMILGLMESQRGRDATAVADLRQAEEVRPDDPLASYYLGQALVLVGQPDAAAEAFERAIARKPARADLLEVYQALGRVHQRAHHNDKALAVWTRLEKQFPDDLRVQEQIATALAEESDPAQALPRYEALAKKTTDAYRKIQFRMDAADLKVRLGKQAEALKDFESLLSQLNPDGWLYREVRRRIEEVFLKNDDQAGLATYYEKWVNTNPEDVDAMSRLGRTLALQGRAAESRAWFEKAVKLAPSRRELRLALVEQLVQDKKIAEAAAQYEALAKADPGNPDTLRDWGRILLRDESKPEADRKKAAAAVWNKLVQARPKDAATAVQVADLLRQAEMPEEAIALYKKAIALAPDSAQYREYLTEEAIAMLWRGFDKSPDLESRLGIVARLTNLYMQQNQFDRLITRLERAGREADRQRETTICRATAYSTSGDYGTRVFHLRRLRHRPPGIGAAPDRQHPRHPTLDPACRPGRDRGRLGNRGQVPEAALRNRPQR
jgi:tetratricopeptide (TPR) repeat protein